MVWALILELLIIIISPIFTLLGQAFALTGFDRVMTEVKPFIDMIFQFGSQILWLILDLDFTKYLLGLVLAIETGVEIYKIILWIIKKIPVINLK